MLRDTKHLQAESTIYRGRHGQVDVYDITVTIPKLQAQRIQRLLRDRRSAHILAFRPENRYRSLLYMLAEVPVVQKLLLKGLTNASNSWNQLDKDMHTRSWPFCAWENFPDEFSINNEEDRVLACMLIGRYNTGNACLRVLKDESVY